MITRYLEYPWYDYCIICSYDVTGADFENSLFVFDQSERDSEYNNSSCCLVRADSGLRLASKSQALLITCTEVRVVRFSREMRWLLKCLKVSLRPLQKCLSVACHPLLVGNCILGTLVSLQCATVECSSLGLVLRGEKNYEWTVWQAPLRDSGLRKLS